MTHNDLVERAVKWLRNTKNCKVVFAEIVTSAHSIPDAIGWKNGRSVLVECKRTRSDFFNDGKKISHKLDLLPGCYRWYFTTPGLVSKEEVPTGWGLAECHKRNIRVVKQAPHIRGNRENALDQELRILLSACRRHQIGVTWHHDLARFEPATKKKRKTRRKRIRKR